MENYSYKSYVTKQILEYFNDKMSYNSILHKQLSTYLIYIANNSDNVQEFINKIDNRLLKCIEFTLNKKDNKTELVSKILAYNLINS